MRAVFYRKEPEIEANEFCVEKVIVLPAGEYESFTKHLMHDYDFIRDNVDLMCEKDGVWHCLLVTGEGTEDGVLVESQILCLCAIGKGDHGTASGNAGNTDCRNEYGNVGGERNGRERN